MGRERRVKGGAGRETLRFFVQERRSGVCARVSAVCSRAECLPSSAASTGAVAVPCWSSCGVNVELVTCSLWRPIRFASSRRRGGRGTSSRSWEGRGAWELRSGEPRPNASAPAILPPPPPPAPSFPRRLRLIGLAPHSRPSRARARAARGLAQGGGARRPRRPAVDAPVIVGARALADPERGLVFARGVPTSPARARRDRLGGKAPTQLTRE
jgi:hypothetical protein